MVDHCRDDFRRDAEVLKINHVLGGKIVTILRVGHEGEHDVFGDP
jgi:hypothetical protein